MEEIKQAWDIVLGEGVFEETIRRLAIIFGSLAAVLLLMLIVVVWRAIACAKIKKAILALSERPNDEQANALVEAVAHISPIGRFFAKVGFRFGTLTKGECRNIYNSTVLNSSAISSDNKRKVRNSMLRLGCTGLTEVSSNQ